MSQSYNNYSFQQWGGGNSGIGRIYAGAPFQRGAGIGSFLGGVFRYVLPLLKRSATAVGKEMLQTGLNIASDVGELKKPFKQAFQERMRQSGSNLQQKAKDNLDRFMRGEGYKVSGKSLPPHLTAILARKKRKSGAKKKKSKVKRVVKKRIGRKLGKKKKEAKNRRKRRSGKKKIKKRKIDFVDIFR